MAVKAFDKAEALDRQQAASRERFRFLHALVGRLSVYLSGARYVSRTFVGRRVVTEGKTKNSSLVKPLHFWQKMTWQ